MAKLKDSRVYGNLDIDSVLTVASDTTINGNLTVTGNTIYSYVDTMKITDPILEMGGADAGALSSDDGKDRGSLLHYYNGGVVDAFMGWDNSASEFILGSNVSVTNEVVTVSEYGNLHAGKFIGSGAGLTAIPGGNVTGTVAYANMSSYAGIVTSSAQPNITSVGTLVDVTTSGNVNATGTMHVTGTSTLTGDVTMSGNASVSGNLTVTGTIYANVAGSLTAPGTTTQVLFNDGGAVNAVSGFTFSKSDHSLTLAGNVTGDTIIGNAFSGNGNALSHIYGPNVSGYVPNADHSTIANIANVAYSVDGANVVGEVSVANTVSNPAQGNITSVGSLTSLTVVGNISGQDNLAISHNATIGGNLTVTKDVGAANGTFSGTLDVTGNASAGNFSTGIISATGNVGAANFNTTGTANIGNLKIAGQVNGNLIPDANVTYSLGNATNRWNDLYLAGNTIYLGDQTIESNASALFTSADLAAGNLTATVNVYSGNVYANSGLVKATNLEGTLQTASQPNITTVGTLGNLSVTGNVAAGNIKTDNLLYANGVAWDLQQAAGSNTQLQFNLNGDFGSDANLTFDAGYGGGALSAPYIRATGMGGLDVYHSANISENLTVSGNVSTAKITVTGNANSGNVYTTNVTATGGVSALALTSNTVTATSGDLTLNGQGTNANVVLAPTGTGTVDVSDKRITNLATPTADSDAVTKGYVDSVAQGLSVKAAAHLATASDLGATYDDNTQTLTGPSEVLEIDLHGADVNDRILVKDQSTAKENGIYVVTNAGSLNTPWVLTRASDMNTSSEVYGAFVFISEGSTNKNTGWTVSVTDENFTTLGTDPITFTQFSGAGTYSADSGVKLNGTVFSADVDNSTIDISSGKIHVKDGLTLVTPNIGAATGTSLALTGSANVGGDITTTGNITANNVTGTFHGSFTGTVSATIGASGSNTQVQYNDSGNIGANVNFTFDSAYAGGALSAPHIRATGLAGLEVTHSANIYENLNVSGNISGDKITITGNANSGNIYTTNVTATGTVDAAQLKGNGYQITHLTGTNVVGDVSGADHANVADVANVALSINGANVSGDVSGANHANIADVANTVAGANVTGTVASATNAGHVTASAQANITSVGTLISLDVTGNIGSGGILTDNYYWANGTPVDFQTAAGNAGELQFKSGSGNDLAASSKLKFNTTSNTFTVTGDVSVANTLSATDVTATNLTGTLTTAAQPNVTSVGTLTGLTVSGTTNLGSNSNVHITGGSSGQYLQTDGLGALTWATINTSLISNGTSNVSIPSADGNVVINVGATQIIQVTGVGANVTGSLDATGNVTANNITAANVIAASGGIAANSAITGTVKVAGGMSATGNIYTGKAVGFANNNGGTDSAAYIQFNASANSLDFIFN